MFALLFLNADYLEIRNHVLRNAVREWFTFVIVRDTLNT